jgi:hypothetical protein
MPILAFRIPDPDGGAYDVDGKTANLRFENDTPENLDPEVGKPAAR